MTFYKFRNDYLWHIERFFHPSFRARGKNCTPGLMPISVWRFFYRLNDATAPWIVIGGGTDCDGMRCGVEQVFWTKRGAERSWNETCDWADGPMYGDVHFRFSKEAREHLASLREWNDDRDRYAERAGY